MKNFDKALSATRALAGFYEQQDCRDRSWDGDYEEYNRPDERRYSGGKLSGTWNRFHRNASTAAAVGCAAGTGGRMEGMRSLIVDDDLQTCESVAELPQKKSACVRTS